MLVLHSPSPPEEAVFSEPSPGTQAARPIPATAVSPRAVAVAADAVGHEGNSVVVDVVVDAVVDAVVVWWAVTPRPSSRWARSSARV